MSTSVCVVGCGARTAVGISAEESAAAVRAGISRVGQHPFAVDRFGEPMMVAQASYVDEEASGVDRLAELGLPAAGEALTSLSGVATDVPLWLGLPGQRPGLPPNLGETIASRLEGALEGHAQIAGVSVGSMGHSAGLMAIEAACGAIADGTAHLCLAGGIESYLEPETLEWLDYRKQLHSASNSWGFIPGEAAGFCLLASRRAAERHGLPVLGEIVSIATSWETVLMESDEVCTGLGLSEALQRAIEPLALSGGKVDQVICDMNGERFRVDEFGFSLARTAEHFSQPGDFLAPADCWGDVGAASGPLFFMLALAAATGGYASGPHTLVWTSSESGERSAALIRHVFNGLG